MKQVILLFLIAICFSFKCHSERKDQIIIARIEYVYSLKSFIEQNVWKGFDDKKFDVPLVYYTDSICYITNPTDRFLDSYKASLIFKNNDIKIYKTCLLDSVPFHMSVSVIFGDSTADYSYKSPFMNCSSFEITKNTIPDVSSTEEWATMILHEYFHGFQFRHPKFLDYYEKNIVSVSAPQDTLTRIYKHNKWFKESVDKENDLLLSAISTGDNNEVYKSIDTFFQLRMHRRAQAKQLLNFDIKPIEGAYETMEGTARYIEYSLYGEFAVKQPDGDLIKSDTCFHSYSYFRNFKLDNAKWLYITSKTTYFYASGFNIARLLDKLGIEYKSRLFKEGGISLEQILWENTIANLQPSASNQAKPITIYKINLSQY